MRRYVLFSGLLMLLAALIFSSFVIAQTAANQSFFDYLHPRPEKTLQQVNRQKRSAHPELQEAIHDKILRKIITVRRFLATEKGDNLQPVPESRVQDPSNSGSISGCVYEQDGVTPIQKVVVISVFDDYGGYMGSDFVSEFNHCYQIGNLPPGDYYVYASSDYYIDEFYDNTTEFSQATLVHVNEGQAVTNINFALQRSTTGSSAISGTVTDANGLPVFECSITVFDLNFNAIHQVSPNANGYYIVSGLAVGSYKLYLSYYGSQNFADEWYENASNFSDADIVETSYNDTTENVNFALNWGGVIVGKVLQPNGAPLGTNDYVSVTAFNMNQGYAGYGFTDENGNFSITKLMTGSYKLLFEYDGINNFIGGYYQNANNFANATPIEVTAGDTVKDITYQLKQGASISGQVTGPSGVAIEWEVEIEAYNEAGENVASAQSETNGLYTISGLAPGRYRLFANYISMYASNIIQTPASEWYDGVYDENLAQWITVESGATIKNIDFTLEAGGAISGYVYSPENVLLNYSGSVEAYDMNGEFVREGINANLGQYIVAGLPTGSYKIYFSYQGDENYMSEFYDGENTIFTADVVNVTAGNWTSGKDFTLDYVSGIKGMVQDEVGNALMGDSHFAIVYAMDSQSSQFIDMDAASVIGGYKILLHGGQVKIAACTGYGNWMTQHDSLALTFYGQGASLYDPNAKSVTVISDSILELDAIKLDKMSGAISGRIFAPVTDELVTNGNYYVFAFDENGCLAKVSAFEKNYGFVDGSYALRGLRPGNYYLLAMANSEQAGVTIWQSTMWYGGILSQLTFENLLPKTDIPQGALAVSVGNGETANIDFHLTMPVGVDFAVNQKSITSYQLYQNYPNPFNPETAIRYNLAKRALVELSVYNLLGQRVAILVNKKQDAGAHKIVWHAQDLPAGIYFIQLKAEDFSQTRKCLLLK